VGIVAGSSTMPGAAALCVDGALSCWASAIRSTIPDVEVERWTTRPEVVRWPARVDELVEAVLESARRSRAVVLGPGLGRSPQLGDALNTLVVALAAPIVLDGDALALVSVDQLAQRAHSGRETIVTPHAGVRDLGRSRGLHRPAA
jgi:NAD(P)H-hydrate epimerase